MLTPSKLIGNAEDGPDPVASVLGDVPNWITTGVLGQVNFRLTCTKRDVESRNILTWELSSEPDSVGESY